MLQFLLSSVLLILITFPIAAMTIAEVSERRARSRRQAVAQRSSCERCGETLGCASLQRADEEWAEKIAALRRDRPDIRFRLKRSIFAVCVVCGTEYGYDEMHATFHPLVDGRLPHLQDGPIDAPAMLPRERSHPKT